MPRKRKKPPVRSIGERIDLIIAYFHINAKEMAIKLGIHKNRLSDYRLGKTRIPKELIRLICYIYEVNEHWLTTGEGEMFEGKPLKVSEEGAPYCVPEFDDLTMKIALLVKDLDGEMKRDILRHLQEKKRFEELKKTVNELERRLLAK